MSKLIIYKGLIVNEQNKFIASIVILDDKIVDIIENIDLTKFADYKIIDASDKIVLPGIIDTHVHFREPGLTHKADIFTESRAAAAGGVTTFFDMPNTIPQTTDFKTLNQKFEIASKNSLINFSFYIGATNNNFDVLKKIKKVQIPAIKLFYGSSTGNMLVDNQKTLEKLFKDAELPIVVHSEDDTIIKNNIQQLKRVGIELQAYHHPRIRSAQACVEATRKLVALANKYNTKLHFLHITTKEELEFFNSEKLESKLITAETSPNYLFFDSNAYQNLGMKIKCNPAIKGPEERLALIEALNSGKIDTIGTDHAPHTLEEKQNTYEKAPSGIPTIQHSLNVMLELVEKGMLPIELIPEKMAHNPAKLFSIKNRGFVRKNYYADLVIVDLKSKTIVTSESLFYKCKWSPLEGYTFNSKIHTTIVNGNIVYQNDKIIDESRGVRVEFER